MITSAAILALVLTAGVVAAGQPGGAGGDPQVPHFEVKWSALAGGGAGSPLTGGGFSVSSTLGQATAGRAVGAAGEACAGFWCAWRPYEVYLPVVLRGR